ncbi:MAG: DUF6492 family protein [Rhabdochlamydiaceae bacterium]|jgi:hypothetical protein
MLKKILIVFLAGLALLCFTLNATLEFPQKTAICWISNHLNKLFSKKISGYWFHLVDAYGLTKVSYRFEEAPIDVIIPCIAKDKETLDLCIEGIRKNGKNIRRIIILSSEPISKNAEWFDEKKFPFTKYEVALEITQDEKKAKELLAGPSRIGWIYQQFLKFYAPFVIPDISSNVLLLDADTVFLKPVAFVGPSGEGLYNPGTEHHQPYFRHAARLIPGFKKIFKGYSGISHHMLFQKSILADLMSEIKLYHHVEPWKAMCHCIDHRYLSLSSLSEYEIYFNFAFMRTSQVKVRPLKWANISSLDEIATYQEKGYDYVSCHAYLRAEKG